MSYTFDALKAEYTSDLSDMRFTKSSEAIATAKRLLVNKSRFMTVQQQCGVPALWLMPTFEREGPSFSAYFGNGDPLNRPTRDVPRGRGPFATWEDGTIDALTLDHVTAHPPDGWTWEWACYQWEKWNGFGPREHGRPTGYLWSGTSIYQGGKYVSDGVWSPGTFDQQLGTVIVAVSLAQLDADLAAGFTDVPSSVSIPAKVA